MRALRSNGEREPRCGITWSCIRRKSAKRRKEETVMHGIIYLIGLVVVILAVLALLGLH